MPRPNPTPCGGEGQPACPPVPATEVNYGDVIVINGQSYVLEAQDENEQEPAA